MADRSAEEMRELTEPNSMAGTSQRVREMGPGFAGLAHARPSDETNTDPEVEAFDGGVADEDDEKEGDK